MSNKKKRRKVPGLTVRGSKNHLHNGETKIAFCWIQRNQKSSCLISQDNAKRLKMISRLVNNLTVPTVRHLALWKQRNKSIPLPKISQTEQSCFRSHVFSDLGKKKSLLIIESTQSWRDGSCRFLLLGVWSQGCVHVKNIRSMWSRECYKSEFHGLVEAVIQ